MWLLVSEELREQKKQDKAFENLGMQYNLLGKIENIYKKLSANLEGLKK